MKLNVSRAAALVSLERYPDRATTCPQVHDLISVAEDNAKCSPYTTLVQRFHYLVPYQKRDTGFYCLFSLLFDSITRFHSR